MEGLRQRPLPDRSRRRSCSRGGSASPSSRAARRRRDVRRAEAPGRCTLSAPWPPARRAARRADDGARQALWDDPRRYHAGGGTVLLTSHYLEEVQALAERVVVIDQGVVKANDSLDAILRRVSLRRVVVVQLDLRDRPRSVQAGQRRRAQVRDSASAPRASTSTPSIRARGGVRADGRARRGPGRRHGPCATTTTTAGSMSQACVPGARDVLLRPCRKAVAQDPVVSRSAGEPVHVRARRGGGPAVAGSTRSSARSRGARAAHGSMSLFGLGAGLAVRRQRHRDPAARGRRDGAARVRAVRAARHGDRLLAVRKSGAPGVQVILFPLAFAGGLFAVPLARLAQRDLKGRPDPARAATCSSRPSRASPAYGAGVVRAPWLDGAVRRPRGRRLRSRRGPPLPLTLTA